MKSKFILMFLLLVFLVSCDFQEDSELPNYRVGTEGINFEFITFPSYEIQVGDQIDIEIEMKNKGAYEAKEVFVSLETNPENQIQFENGEVRQIRNEKDFKGKSQDFPLGDVRALDLFRGTALNIKEVYGKQRQVSFLANICYDYQTIASPSVCIGKKGKTSLDCIVDETNAIRYDFPEGQGAPIVISSVVERIITEGKDDNEKTKLTFEIYIDNYGDGRAILPSDDKENDYYNLCMTPEASDYDVVYMNLEMADYGNAAFNCKNLASNKGNLKKVKLQNTNVVKCEVILKENKASYYSPLKITLDYIYKTMLSESAYVVSEDYYDYR